MQCGETEAGHGSFRACGPEDGSMGMDGTTPAAPAGQPEMEPDAEAVPASCLAVVMDKSADASRIYRVDAPDRVLRIWAMLSSAAGELHQASLPPEMTARLQRQFDALTNRECIFVSYQGETKTINGWIYLMDLAAP